MIRNHMRTATILAAVLSICTFAAACGTAKVATHEKTATHKKAEESPQRRVSVNNPCLEEPKEPKKVTELQALVQRTTHEIAGMLRIDWNGCVFPMPEDPDMFRAEELKNLGRNEIFYVGIYVHEKTVQEGHFNYADATVVMLLKVGGKVIYTLSEKVEGAFPASTGGVDYPPSAAKEVAVENALAWLVKEAAWLTPVNPN